MGVFEESFSCDDLVYCEEQTAEIDFTNELFYIESILC